MKLKFDCEYNKSQPDPFIFADEGRFYMYVTAADGVEAYSADCLTGQWHFEGIVGRIDGGRNYWAPCIIKHSGKYYIYVSCDRDGSFENLYVLTGDSPLGPFGGAVRLFDHFSIDAHAVENDDGLFLWYAEDNTEAENGRIGTRIYVDRLYDPCTPARNPREVIIPTFDEEMFRANRFGDGRDWYTIEGAFWFREDGWQYLMYSGACFENDTYHIGYASARSFENDLTKVDFVKHTDNGEFAPLLIRNEFEEGVGHNSVIRIEGRYYAVYHGRDYLSDDSNNASDRRTARVCRLNVSNGIITAERYEDRL